MAENRSEAPEDALELEEDFHYLLQLLPDGWQEKARSLGALRRCRGVSDAESLLRVLLIHLADGCSLRETSVRIRRGNIAQLSDVAIMDRLRLSGEWFRWMNTQLMNSLVRRAPQSVYGQHAAVKLVDATRVQEPGPTGSSWVLHYCVALSSLACEQVIVTDQRGNGESFKRFKAKAGDLYLADRAYGVRPGIFYLREAGADVLVRFALDNLPLQDTAGRRWDLLKHLRRLSSTQVGDWPVNLLYEGQRLSGRVCAIKKSRQARLAAQKKLLLKNVSNQIQTKDSTLESSGYIFVFTTLPSSALRATQALELYRGRWQIELVFKRLKSILSLGYLRKEDPVSARSWLEGKLFVALLIEALLAQAESFFPWGYPIKKTASTV
jgi:Transposase DDE domain